MLRIIQRDIEEYLPFLFSKYTIVYDEYHTNVSQIQRKSKNSEVVLSEKRGILIEQDSESGAVYPKSPVVMFSDMLRGREKLSVDENRMLDLYRSINDEGKDSVYSTLMQERKKHPSKKTRAIQAAMRKAISENKPMPPVSEIDPEE